MRRQTNGGEENDSSDNPPQRLKREFSTRSRDSAASYTRRLFPCHTIFSGSMFRALPGADFLQRRLPRDWTTGVAMLNRFLFLAAALLTAAVVFPVGTFAQNYPKITSADGWAAPVWEYPPITAQNRKPAPRRDLSGMWGP